MLRTDEKTDYVLVLRDPKTDPNVKKKQTETTEELTICLCLFLPTGNQNEASRSVVERGNASRARATVSSSGLGERVLTQHLDVFRILTHRIREAAGRGGWRLKNGQGEKWRVPS